MFVKLSADTRARMEHFVEMCKRSMHWLMREYVEREEKCEALRQESVSDS